MKKPGDLNYKNRSFSGLFSRLLEDLSLLGIYNFESYLQRRSARDYFCDYERLKDIEFSFAKAYINILKNIEEKLKKDKGVHFLFSEKVNYLNSSQKNKILAFSKSTFLPVDPINFIDLDSTEDNLIDFIYGPDLTGCLSFAYNNISDVKRGLLTPLPEYIEWIDIEKFHQSYESNILNTNKDSIYGPWSKALYDGIEYYDTPSNIFKTTLKNEDISHNNELLKLGLVLPSLENVPTSVVRKLRDDYKGDFQNFQNALIRLADQFSSENDDTRFRLIFEEIQENINELNKTFEKIKKVHQSLPIIIGMITLVFYFTSQNPKITNYFNTIFSGIGSAFFLEVFRDIKDSKIMVEKSPFYFPYLLDKMAPLK